MITRSLIAGIIAALAMVLLLVAFDSQPLTTKSTPVSSGKQPDVTPQPSTQDPPEKPAGGDQTKSRAGLLPEATTVEIVEPADKIKIHGRVTDENNQPLEGVLIADEINLGSTRSKSDGSYQIPVQQPLYKTPILIFLLDGYRENRVGIATQNTPVQSNYEIDVTLQSSADTTNVHGWVGNALGEGLAGRKITIRARAGQSVGIKFYTVITTSNGEFMFEGIRADTNYKLVIEPSEQYAGYTFEPLQISQQTPRLTIILDRLSLVDVDGLIIGIDNAPIANFSMNVQNLSLDYPDRRITSDSSGFFALRGFPAGELKLSTNAPEYFKITDFVLSADNYQNQTIVIDRGNYFLNGWISDENGVPVESARVTLSAKFSNDDYQSHSHRSVVAGIYWLKYRSFYSPARVSSNAIHASSTHFFRAGCWRTAPSAAIVVFDGGSLLVSPNHSSIC